jgi:hypothetical protein
MKQKSARDKLSPKEKEMRTYLVNRMKRYNMIPANDSDADMLFEIPSSEKECDELVSMILKVKKELHEIR